ncbi:MAG: hypothetical protein EBU31_11785, partial [Proteobacteria bacterium]|nr:hypothetical protein [Pseudomonadota bacterium]
MFRPASSAVASVLLLASAGCTFTPGGSVETVGSGDTAVRLVSEFANGTYSIESAQTTVVFSDIPY